VLFDIAKWTVVIPQVRRKILFSHATLENGGAEKVFFSMVHAARLMDMEVELVIGKIHRSSEGLLKDQDLKILPIWTKFLPPTIIAMLTENLASSIRSKSDIIVNTTPLEGPFLRGDIIYVHYPYFFSELLLNESVAKKFFGFILLLWKRMREVYDSKYDLPRVALFNSNYTMAITEKYCSSFSFIQPSKKQVLYPPVDSKTISDSVRSLNKIRKGNFVLTISRFVPNKKLERILDVAKRTHNSLQFKIVGSLGSTSYVHMLKRKIEDMRLSERVSIELNVSEARKLEYLASSNIYFHPMIGEHFGIAIVEAMAAGCVPCVASVGGPAEIVPAKFRFNSIEEAAAIIENQSSYIDESFRQSIVRDSFRYDRSVFQSSISRIISSICNLDEKI
jgi:glycosyltransferase involved in cell wall biosynthesis